jgi:hypothetical protein
VFTRSFQHLTEAVRTHHNGPPAWPFCSDPLGSTVKLTFAISVVALVLIAGTTTICMSGAVNDNTTEYGSAHATMEALFNPHAQVCR